MIYLGTAGEAEAAGDLLTVARAAGCKCYRPSDAHCTLIIEADRRRLAAIFE